MSNWAWRNYSGKGLAWLGQPQVAMHSQLPRFLVYFVPAVLRKFYTYYLAIFLIRRIFAVRQVTLQYRVHVSPDEWAM